MQHAVIAGIGNVDIHKEGVGGDGGGGVERRGADAAFVGHAGGDIAPLPKDDRLGARFVAVEDQHPVVMAVGNKEPIASVEFQPGGVVEAGGADPAVVGAIAHIVGLADDVIGLTVHGIIREKEHTVVARICDIDCVAQQPGCHPGGRIHAAPRGRVRRSVGRRLRCDVILAKNDEGRFVVVQRPVKDQHSIVAGIGHHQVVVGVGDNAVGTVECADSGRPGDIACHVALAQHIICLHPTFVSRQRLAGDELVVVVGGEKDQHAVVAGVGDVEHAVEANGKAAWAVHAGGGGWIQDLCGREIGLAQHNIGGIAVFVVVDTVPDQHPIVGGVGDEDLAAAIIDEKIAGLVEGATGGQGGRTACCEVRLTEKCVGHGVEVAVQFGGGGTSRNAELFRPLDGGFDLQLGRLSQFRGGPGREV